MTKQIQKNGNGTEQGGAKIVKLLLSYWTMKINSAHPCKIYLVVMKGRNYRKKQSKSCLESDALHDVSTQHRHLPLFKGITLTDLAVVQHMGMI